MDLQLQSKRALVSGSTAGIGLAIATILAREGADVIVNGRSAARVEAAIKSVRAAGAKGDVQGLAADFSTVAGLDTVTRAFPKIDILVNNLGMYQPKPFEQISDEEWVEIFEVNVLSGIRLSRA
ncbi:MAG: fabG 8, partial [Pedosphaera sp.]|nr:fabG 8 [Pedosphaera sp.]